MTPATGSQRTASGHTQDTPESHPRLGEVPEGLNTFEGVRMEAVRMGMVRIAPMNQLPADGPNASWMPKQAQLAAG